MASCGTITVVPAFEQSAVSASCDVQTGNIEEGETAQVDVEVTNDNDTAASFTLDLLIDDERATSEDGTVAGGSTETLGFEVEDLGEGDHSVDVELDSVSES